MQLTNRVTNLQTVLYNLEQKCQTECSKKKSDLPTAFLLSYFTSQTSPFIKKSFSLRVGFFACTSSIC